MKNLLVKLLPLLAIVIAAPAFAGTNEFNHDRSNRHVSYGENQYRNNRSYGSNHRNEYVKIKIVKRRNYSPRSNHQEASRHHEYRGYHQVRGHRDNYYR